MDAVKISFLTAFFKVLFDSCLETLRISSMALWILIAATLFGIFYNTAGAQSLVMEMVQGLPVNRWLILVGMQIILLIFGMFMDDYAVVTICAPIFLPVAKFCTSRNHYEGHLAISPPPFVAIQLLVLIIAMLFPQVALWLPGKIF
jgi:TRAP-type C4-dicarboxylate transport system permease large subunit